jgi:pimeloyl-ACP methyl ester carboxylesterase
MRTETAAHGSSRAIKSEGPDLSVVHGCAARRCPLIKRLGFAFCATLLTAGCLDSNSSGDTRAGLVDVGGGRNIFLACRGTGSPTVVLISGFLEAGWIWSYALTPDDPVHQSPIDAFSAGGGDPQKLPSAVFPAVAKFTRVCNYDRPNTTRGKDIADERDGKISTPVAQPHLLESDVADLRAVLTAAGESGPYVIVAHSYGGMISELYSSIYARDVVGRVLVDVTSVYLKQTMTDEQFNALVASANNPSPPGTDPIQAVEAIDLRLAVETILAHPPVPPMPVAVLTADKPPKLDDPAFPNILAANRLLAIQLQAVQVTKTNSGHHIQVEQPQLVVDATRAVVDAVRSGSPLLKPWWGP